MLDGQENSLQVAAPPKTYAHVPQGQGTLDAFIKSAPLNKPCDGRIRTSASEPSTSQTESLLHPDLVERSTHVIPSDTVPRDEMMFDGQAYPPAMGENLKRNFDRTMDYDTSGVPCDNKRKRLF